MLAKIFKCHCFAEKNQLNNESANYRWEVLRALCLWFQLSINVNGALVAVRLDRVSPPYERNMVLQRPVLLSLKIELKPVCGKWGTLTNPKLLINYPD